MPSDTELPWSNRVTASILWRYQIIKDSGAQIYPPPIYIVSELNNSYAQ